MRAFYQTEWHQIPFSSFAELSSKNLADQHFYDAFYQTLFKKYAGYDDLPKGWRHCKTEIADWLVTQIPEGARVLSIGCGLGFIEQRISRMHGTKLDLHVQDFSAEALKWLREVVPAENIHVSDETLGDAGFDFIYLCALDYALTNGHL